ncbi:MAG: U32 family peptidase [Devosia sp.]|uniref:ubiquinone anaerobic biosynthesis protein UbiV n=1 Tax=Devosia sp. 66-22 TaxID=1895753 RepID=UPI00092AAE91|nr:U32 family peptidase [Devosia sp. 66-22]MBN9347436.1 U32 family peptidase [Devosia sp.]OJX53657.1 MAG: hypothetical protein BGO81_13930 [Devosia sp. 66-22]
MRSRPLEAFGPALAAVLQPMLDRIEVVCSKRIPFFDVTSVQTALERAGKKVVLSTLSEVTVAADRRAVRDACGVPDCEIEVNDAAAFESLAGRPFRIGQLLNCYNEEVLRFLAGRGATHVCLPPEMPLAAVEVMARTAESLGITTEVQVFGRASLALSARCYHARAHGRVKDNCQFVCERDPDGLDLRTVDGDDFLAINGIQTLSWRYLNLSREVGRLRDVGVTHLRLSPHSFDMAGIAGVFAGLCSGRLAADVADEQLAALAPSAVFANGFAHRQPGYLRV